VTARRLGVALVLVAAAVVLWVRLLPLSLGSVEPAARDQFRYVAADGRSYVYLGDVDSYLWLRHARNYLRTATTCDAIVDGECRDTFATAPVGQPMIYARSLHIAAIVALHRVITVIAPDYPLAATAYWVPVLVGVLGVVSAFAIGSRLAGPVAGLAAALVIGTDPLFLRRSIGSDNDVWNVVVPLFAAWAAIEALAASRPARQAALAAVAALLVGVHAAVWRGWIFTYGVLLAGIAAGSVLGMIEAGARGRVARRTRGAALTLGVFWTVAAVGAIVAGAGGEYLALPATLVGSLFGTAAPVATSEVAWPDVFQTVSELKRPGLDGIAAALHGPLYFFVAWLGLLLILLPERGWRWWHYLLLIGGNYLYRYLLTTPVWSPLALVALLGLPLAGGVALWLATPRPGADRRRRGALVVVAWFLAALFQAYGGHRFIMLVVAPAGILFGVALGRLHGWLVRTTSPLAGRYAAVLRPVLFVAVAAVAILPVQRGVAAARTAVPLMNDAWWDTLTGIRDSSPPDTIVNTWWDYGHWVKYVAERRVSADGGTLGTQVSHWIGRALLAPSEQETVGLLRMLNCGSDVTADGAYGRLLAAGINPIAAHGIVVAITGLERDAARGLLEARGLDRDTSEGVLRATHCPPPPARLILASHMIAVASTWHYLGGWDPLHAWIATAVRERPVAEIVEEVVRRFGIAADKAHRLSSRAAALESASDVGEFVAPRSGYLVGDWVPCRDAGGDGWICPIRRPVYTDGTILDAVVYHPDAPQAAHLRLRARVRGRGVQTARTAIPATLLVAGPQRLDETSFPDAIDETLGVLVDTVEHRALIGPPDLLRSTFTHLMFLDGRYAELFEKVDDRTGYRGERVVTWALRDDDAGPRSAAEEPRLVSGPAAVAAARPSDARDDLSEAAHEPRAREPLSAGRE
jgi:dolichyl-phosphooligosaccharide-protein glycotransferase